MGINDSNVVRLFSIRKRARVGRVFAKVIERYGHRPRNFASACIAIGNFEEKLCSGNGSAFYRSAITKLEQFRDTGNLLYAQALVRYAHFKIEAGDFTGAWSLVKRARRCLKNHADAEAIASEIMSLTARLREMRIPEPLFDQQ